MKAKHWTIVFCFCSGEVHWVPGQAARGATDAVHERLPRGTHGDRVHRHRHQPAAGLRPLAVQQPRLWLSKGERQGKHHWINDAWHFVSSYQKVDRRIISSRVPRQFSYPLKGVYLLATTAGATFLKLIDQSSLGISKYIRLAWLKFYNLELLYSYLITLN